MVNQIANLEEIWETGAVFEAEEPCEPGSRVEFRGGAKLYSATVRRVERHEFGWRVHVEFAPETPWSPADFKPGHMVDPLDLKRD